MNSWEEQFHRYVVRDDIENAMVIFDNLASGKTTPLAADKVKALKIIENNLNNLDHAQAWLYHLLKNHNPSARDLGAMLAANLIPWLYPQSRQEVCEIMAHIAGDPHWEVRESASHVLLQLVKIDFNEAYSILQQWVTHPSEYMRRAVALSVKKIGKERHPYWGGPLLDLIEPLLYDRSVYVRKNLGAFAIGDGLLRYYPELTLERLYSWSALEDEQVLWNVAMVFSAAEATKHLDEALAILASLARDKRRYVWRAVASAIRNLGRRKPERVIPVIMDWMDDPHRALPAEVALKFLVPIS